MIEIFGASLCSSSFSFALSTLSVNKSSRLGDGETNPKTSSVNPKVNVNSYLQKGFQKQSVDLGVQQIIF